MTFYILKIEIKDYFFVKALYAYIPFRFNCIMMKRLILLTWLLAAFINSDLFSQTKEGARNNFYDAESWILFEAYQDALPLYQQLVKSYPDNSNFKYRIGQCYINIPGEKIKAISYLEDAVKNINPKYKE